MCTKTSPNIWDQLALYAGHNVVSATFHTYGFYVPALHIQFDSLSLLFSIHFPPFFPNSIQTKPTITHLRVLCGLCCYFCSCFYVRCLGGSYDQDHKLIVELAAKLVQNGFSLLRMQFVYRMQPKIRATKNSYNIKIFARKCMHQILLIVTLHPTFRTEREMQKPGSNVVMQLIILF